MLTFLFYLRVGIMFMRFGDLDEMTQAQWERAFLFAVMWSLGALLELPDRKKFEEYVRTHPSKLNWPRSKVISREQYSCIEEIIYNRPFDKDSKK